MRAILIIDDDVQNLAQTIRSLETMGYYKMLQTMSVDLPPSSEITPLLRRVYKLTPRECELALLQLRQPSLTWNEIAEQEITTRNTIKTYYQRIYKKLGIRGRSEMYHVIHQHFGATVPQIQQREFGVM